MGALHVRRGDLVEVLSGKDRGKRGKVLRVLPKEEKVVVEGVHVVKRHTKPRPPQILQGGILEKTLPIHASKVMLVCPHCNKRTRIGKKETGDGVRVRFCKKCGKEIG
jgi:large subunit ribosomal protein L24